MHKLKGKCRQVFKKRRVLRVEPVVAEMIICITGRQVRNLIKSRRIPHHTAKRKYSHHREQPRRKITMLLFGKTEKPAYDTIV